MYYTLTNVQRSNAIDLAEYIDNRCGKKTIGMRSITYTVGWENIESKISIVNISTIITVISFKCIIIPALLLSLWYLSSFVEFLSFFESFQHFTTSSFRQ